MSGPFYCSTHAQCFDWGLLVIKTRWMPLDMPERGKATKRGLTDISRCLHEAGKRSY